MTETWRNAPRTGKRKRALLEYLAAHPGEVRFAELRTAMGVNVGAVHTSLKSLLGEGRVVTPRRGFWALPDGVEGGGQAGPAAETPADASPGAENTPTGTDGELFLCVHCRATTERANPNRYDWEEVPTPHLTCNSPGCLKRADALGVLKVAPSKVEAVKRVPVPAPASFTGERYVNDFQDLNLVECLSAVNWWLAAYSGPANDPVAVEVVLTQEHLKRALELMDERLAEYVGKLLPVGSNDSGVNGGTQPSN